MKNELTQTRVLELIEKNDVNTLIEETLYLEKIIASAAMNKLSIYRISKENYEDLLGTIRLSICESAPQYDVNRGVDYVKYISKMGKFSSMRFLKKQDRYYKKIQTYVVNEDSEEDDIFNLIAAFEEEVRLSDDILLHLFDKILTNEEKKIVKALYFDNKTIKEVAKDMHRSVDYVSINRNRAHAKIKKWF